MTIIELKLQNDYDDVSNKVKKRITSYAENMLKCPDAADKISLEAMQYIRKSIRNMFVKTVGLIYILEARFECGLPLLDEIIDECYKNTESMDQSYRYKMENEVSYLLQKYKYRDGRQKKI